MASIELQPKTRAGARLVASAEALASQLATTAAQRDASGAYPLENIALLKQAGYFVAPIPEHFGGLGVESVFDTLVASSRLARGDASTTIGLNMHLLMVMSIVRRWQQAVAREDQRRVEAFGRSLERIVDDGAIMSAAISEPSQHLTMPGTRATRTADGWLLNGRKIFATMSPAATMFIVSVTYENSDGNPQYAYAEVPAETPGVTINDDWDALGMRASGSNSVSFVNVELPRSAVRGGFPVGDTIGYVDRNLPNGLFHAAASLGIAESAHTAAIKRLAGSGDGHVRAPEQMMVAENAIDLSATRATFGRAGDLIDDFYAAHLTVAATSDEWTTMFAEVQAAKTFVNETATRIVDRALTLSGGGGYMRSHALSRAYRDVRAGGFMQPLGAVRAYEYLAQAALGREPSLS
ncbi:MAG TPA: acyl-CoA dehydrogenase family protein [Chloroflexota bacterium]|jgi:alkylation response protein AidB-like acyl-CoA dehydrogenase|nr:acyl-CoA dehydrogenase family protein [Chloroflexota bacterium]